MSVEGTIPRFDESLSLFVEILAKILSTDIVERGAILRDASGRLAFICRTRIDAEQRKSVENAAKKQLADYCREGAIILEYSQPGVSAIVEQARGYQEKLTVNNGNLVVNVLEQRIVGQDWLEQPVPHQPLTTPPRYVFASIKGGVGRTTALAVVATDLALQGRKVLVIDMDLEAPGIGNMLIPQGELPRFGMLDGYVESGLGGVDHDFLLEMVAASPFGRGKGLIDVVPAIGSVAQQYPANVLAKIARAYLENPNSSGEMVGFLGQTQRLIGELIKLKKYDAVLIDARAGLNESTAAAILGLGAQVLLFGEDTPQTFAGYRYLLAHLARFPHDDENDWLYGIRMVHAKASADIGRQQAFRDKAFDMFKEFFGIQYGVMRTLDQQDEFILPEFSLDDPESPHYAWPVLRDSNYFEFDPLASSAQLTPSLYEQTYKALLDGVNISRNFEDLTKPMS